MKTKGHIGQIVGGMNTKRGFTLIETLVAVLILAVSIAGPLTIAIKGLSSAIFARDQITAFYLAQEAVEYVRFTRDDTFLKSRGASAAYTEAESWGVWTTALAECISPKKCIVSGFEDLVGACPSGDCAPLQFDESSGVYNYDSSQPVSAYTREVQLTAASAEEVEVEVTLHWKTGLFERSFSVRENIHNWQSTPAGSTLECSNGVNDDGDAFVDKDDPGCYTLVSSNGDIYYEYNAFDNSESNGAATDVFWRFGHNGDVDRDAPGEYTIGVPPQQSFGNVIFVMWAAGGGGGDSKLGSSGGGQGGHGGYAEIAVEVGPGKLIEPGEKLTVVVGSGGGPGTNSTSNNATAYGGGGGGGDGAAAFGGGGGGYTAVKKSDGTIILLSGAGGGGGASDSSSLSGGSGGSGGGGVGNGQNGADGGITSGVTSGEGGDGGTQTAGGAGGTQNGGNQPSHYGTAGGALFGGSGGSRGTNGGGGGGGGGGYFGGGGGGGSENPPAGAAGTGGGAGAGASFAVSHANVSGASFQAGASGGTVPGAGSLGSGLSASGAGTGGQGEKPSAPAEAGTAGRFIIQVTTY